MNDTTRDIIYGQLEQQEFTPTLDELGRMERRITYRGRETYNGREFERQYTATESEVKLKNLIESTERELIILRTVRQIRTEAKRPGNIWQRLLDAVRPVFNPEHIGLDDEARRRAEEGARAHTAASHLGSPLEEDDDDIFPDHPTTPRMYGNDKTEGQK